MSEQDGLGSFSFFDDFQPLWNSPQYLRNSQSVRKARTCTSPRNESINLDLRWAPWDLFRKCGICGVPSDSYDYSFTQHRSRVRVPKTILVSSANLPEGQRFLLQVPRCWACLFHEDGQSSRGISNEDQRHCWPTEQETNAEIRLANRPVQQDWTQPKPTTAT